ncbi:MAG TPA: SbcC/MukB-like Walker B domain-containing protein, partial [Microthrixaceae bacterium]|nr:SbcC/MukB-like Walker B domain-containing protein [Microthrixaceae bacterium]
SLADQLQVLDGQHADHLLRRNQLSNEISETTEDLDSLRGRRSNLPRNLLEARATMGRDLGLNTDDLPFAGELIDVADAHAEWRPAAERVLRGFAQSLLVDQDLYPAVSEWVNGRHLGLRLVYERVPRHRVALRPAQDSGGMVLADTLEIAAGPFEEYLQSQVARRAGHLCTRNMAEFREAERAVTIEGQVRSGDRHEKDDRHRADDPRYWLLGWSNQSKIDALEAHLATLQTEMGKVTTALDKVDVERRKLWGRQQALSGLAEYADWRELDVAEAEHRQRDAIAERERLLSGSSKLVEIERRLNDVDTALRELDKRQRHVQDQVATCAERIKQAKKAQQQDIETTAAFPAEVVELARANYSDLEAQLGDGVPTTSSDCRAASDRLTERLQKLIDRAGKEQESHRGTALKHMSIVRNRWPEATTEMDVSIEARSEFVAFQVRLATDDLPTYEEEFKRQLNTETIRELAGFNAWLRRQREGIQERVERINEALSAIDYSPGRIIKLVAEPTPNQEVKQFQKDLRAATDDTLSPDGDRYSEQRFEEVRRIIERFRGRIDHADSDKSWTAKVTDIRNWFTFAASEQDKVSGAEYEHYRDSDGKSGGQKEKLAYTILAASLAYQFGLQWGVEKSRDFRFVVIDEAFGRGSDESTRYALELFAKLGLQLLVVTPLQKVHVIEPYVNAIGFVDNPQGNYSRVQTLTLEEFRERRAKEPR